MEEEFVITEADLENHTFCDHKGEKVCMCGEFECAHGGLNSYAYDGNYHEFVEMKDEQPD